MMTSSNGNIFRATGPLCGEFTGPGKFPTQRPVTRSFDVYFDLRLNKRLSKQPWGWWFETLSWSLWRHRNGKWNLLQWRHVNVMASQITGRSTVCPTDWSSWEQRKHKSSALLTLCEEPPVTSSYGGHGGSFQSYIHMKIHVNCRFPNEVKKFLHKKFLYNTTKTQKSLWSFDGNFSVMCVKFHVKLHRKLLNLWKFNFISKSIFHVKFQIEYIIV